MSDASRPIHESPDPLAELARLIGSNDPFTDFARNSEKQDLINEFAHQLQEQRIVRALSAELASDIGHQAVEETLFGPSGNGSRARPEARPSWLDDLLRRHREETIPGWLGKFVPGYLDIEGLRRNGYARSLDYGLDDYLADGSGPG